MALRGASAAMSPVHREPNNINTRPTRYHTSEQICCTCCPFP